MTPLSRRDFGRLLAAGLPLARTFGARAAHLVVGVSTSSFRDLPRVPGRDNLDDVIAALGKVGATHVELAFANIEPAPPSTAPVMGGSAAYPRRIVLTAEEIAATNAEARSALRTWRRDTAPAHFESLRAKLSAAGLTADAGALAYGESFTDEEVDATFRQAKILGLSTISSPLTMATAARLAPFAERYRIGVAIHNQVDDNPKGEIDTLLLGRALALSQMFRIRLDVGNLTASNADAVAELHKRQSRVALVVMKDRLRNGGASQPFGEGDTPIRGVLDVLKQSASAIPVLVDYDYLGLRSSTAEVAASLGYLSQLGR